METVTTTISKQAMLPIYTTCYLLDNPIPGVTNIEVEYWEYFITSPFRIIYAYGRSISRRIDNRQRQPLQLRSLYSLPNFQFVIPEPVYVEGLILRLPNNKKMHVKTHCDLKCHQQLLSIMSLLGGNCRPSKSTIGGLDFIWLRIVLNFNCHLKSNWMISLPKISRNWKELCFVWK